MEILEKAEKLREDLSKYFNITLRSFIKGDVLVLYDMNINSFIILSNLQKYSKEITENISRSILNKYPNFTINTYFSNNSIIIRYDTVKFSELSDNYANIFSNLTKKDLSKIARISKQFNNISKDQLFWIELIRIKYPNYLKNNYNYNYDYKKLYFGFIDYDKFLEYLDILDYEPDDSDDENEEDVWTVNKFYNKHSDTFKYMLDLNLFGSKFKSSLTSEILDLHDLYTPNNYKYLISYIDMNIKNDNFEVMWMDLFKLALAYSDCLFLDVIYNLSSESRTSKYIDSKLNYILDQFPNLEEFNASNFEWLLSKLDIKATPVLFIELLKTQIIYKRIFINYLIDKLPLDIDDNMLVRFYNILDEITGNFHENDELYYFTLKYLNRLSKNDIEDIFINMINNEEYCFVISLIDKYKDSITKEFMLDILDSLDIKWEDRKNYSDDLLNFLKYVNNL